MKLLRAHIENFRLLRDVTFEFATGATRNVTVIRAANESGKTTLLTALQWGLFGDSALPDFGAGYRLSPLDIPGDSSVAVPISVEIDYEVPTRTGHVQQYRIIRSALETPVPTAPGTATGRRSALSTSRHPAPRRSIIPKPTSDRIFPTTYGRCSLQTATGP